MKIPSLCLALLLPALSYGAGKNEPAAPPDFTTGGVIPPGSRHDWNPGATGLRGWMHSNKLVTSDARQVAVTRVEKDSPAHGQIEVGNGMIEKSNTVREAIRAIRAIRAIQTRPPSSNFNNMGPEAPQALSQQCPLCDLCPFVQIHRGFQDDSTLGESLRTCIGGRGF